MTRFVPPRAARRVLFPTLGLVVLGTALMGFAHTPAGRPLLRWMGMSIKGAGCPLGYDVKASPEQKEAARRNFAAIHRGSSPARARPALGFGFEETTREQVRAWADSHGVKCAAPRSGAESRLRAPPRLALSRDGAPAGDPRPVAHLRQGRQARLARGREPGCGARPHQRLVHGRQRAPVPSGGARDEAGRRRECRVAHPGAATPGQR